MIVLGMIERPLVIFPAFLPASGRGPVSFPPFFFGSFPAGFIISLGRHIPFLPLFVLEVPSLEEILPFFDLISFEHALFFPTQCLSPCLKVSSS